MMNAKDISRSLIRNVYSGRQGCMCGCRGKYVYSEAHRAEASAVRGYDVSADEVNEAQITRVMNIVKNVSAERVEVMNDLDGIIFYLDSDCTDRCWAIYMCKSASI